KGDTGTELVSQIEAFNDLLRNIQVKSAKEPLNSPKTLQSGNAPPLPKLVVGREDAIQELKQRLYVKESEKGSPRLQVLTAMRGWPGVGKTTLAAVLSYDSELMQIFPDGTLWASLGPSPNIISELAIWGRALGTDKILHAKSVDE